MTKEKIRVGGHSKGGNLAIFASAFCKDSVKKQVIEIYNNDGPGMNEINIQKVEYKEILSRLHTYIPQSSVIGRALYHEGKYIVVQSTQKGLMQHYPYTWQVQRDKSTDDNNKKILQKYYFKKSIDLSKKYL